MLHHSNFMKTPILLFCLLLLASCQNAADKVEKHQVETETQLKAAPADSFALGTVINSVTVKTSSAESFALFLPEDYSEDTARPMLIFFDPHGNGNLPLRKYAALAQKYGYMMMGSNNSENGITQAQTLYYAKNLLTEALARFNTSKVYMCGFSGGAKVALMAASQLPQVEAAIYCGATSPIEPTHSLKLLGFAGTADMNYTDMVEFERTLKNTNIEHYLVEWDGKHEFPSAEVFEDAFIFLETGKVPEYENKQATISQKDLKTEQTTKQQYLLAMQSQDLQWWKQTTDSLKANTDKRSERLLAFVSLVCYTYTGQAIKQNNRPLAERIIAIYKMADPNNEAIAEFEGQLEALK